MPVIVQTFPNYSSNPKGTHYHLYCKFQLIKHNPWQNHVINSWGGGEGSANIWIRQYERFLQTDSAQARIPQWLQELQRAQLQIANDEDEDEDYNEIQDQSTQKQDKWMQLCQLNPTFSRSLQTDATVDWEAAARQLPPHLLRDAAKWITVQRHLSTSTSDQSSSLHNQPTNVDSLNHKQRCAYILIQ